MCKWVKKTAGCVVTGVHLDQSPRYSASDLRLLCLNNACMFEHISWSCLWFPYVLVSDRH